MSNLTSKQRKIAYLIGIVVLLIPIIMLGQPETGKIATLRQKFQLGESTLGDVDPTGAAANLVLLGLRGPASTVLWLQADEEKETKDWAKLKGTVNSIITLQPHFKKIWRFQGWNLAFNVSSEWDAVEDRFYWVKEGIKFTEGGAQRNRKYAELPWELGRFTGSKIGNSDEKEFFRKFFVSDPNTDKFNGGPDPDINPEGKDNYLVSREHYLHANERELNNKQNIMARLIFRSYPAKCYQDMASALQREGIFGDLTARTWEDASEAWTGEYGTKEVFENEVLRAISKADPPQGVVQLESNAEAINRLAKANAVPLEKQKEWTDRSQKMVHYRYWRQRCMVEGQTRTVAAHQDIYLGKQLYRAGEINPQGEEGELPSRAQQRLEAGMYKLDAILRDERFASLKEEDEMVEEAMLAVFYWRKVHNLNGAVIPAEYPLKWLWESKQERMNDIQSLFNKESRGHSIR